MSYKLYTDKKEIFECQIHLEGASLTKANSRIIVETENLNLMFEGTIDKDGNCKVPIKKLRGLVSEDTKGTMKLEVIAEDTYFNPWESDFEVDTAKKIKVEVKQQSKPLVKSSKPEMIVKEVKHPFDPVDVIIKAFNEKGITLKSVIKDKKRIAPILENYSTKIKYNGGTNKFIREVIQKLAKT